MWLVVHLMNLIGFVTDSCHDKLGMNYFSTARYGSFYRHVAIIHVKDHAYPLPGNAARCMVKAYRGNYF